MEESFKKFVEIIKKLRAPDGCPWDKEQNLYSLKEHLIEEVYELVDALDKKDINNIKEELGDLLLHVVFHSNIAEEEGLFDITDVINNISEKMIRRHPHVFGEIKVKDSNEVLKNWEEIKKEEKQSRNSIFDGIPGNLPSIQKSYELQKKAAKVGFNWEKQEDCLAKVEEEFDELKSAIKNGSQEEILHEMGDVFFALVNLSIFLGIHPDEALRKCNQRFENRFHYIENKLQQMGKTPKDSNLNEMDKLWDEAKKVFKDSKTFS
jgi:tetrapyrrole methylase family protein/MazG family protein